MAYYFEFNNKYDHGKIKIGCFEPKLRVEGYEQEHYLVVGDKGYILLEDELADASKIPLDRAERRLEGIIPGIVSDLIAAGENAERLLLAFSRFRLARTEQELACIKNRLAFVNHQDTVE